MGTDVVVVFVAVTVLPPRCALAESATYGLSMLFDFQSQNWEELAKAVVNAPGAEAHSMDAHG